MIIMLHAQFCQANLLGEYQYGQQEIDPRLGQILVIDVKGNSGITISWSIMLKKSLQKCPETFHNIKIASTITFHSHIKVLYTQYSNSGTQPKVSQYLPQKC